MRRIYISVLSLTWLMFIATEGCKHHPTSPRDIKKEEGSWVKFTPYNWSHDGMPYESKYCTIYSDAAGTEMKKQLGEIADERFSFILRYFNFNNIKEFKYPPGYPKIEIYLNINHAENINWAYWGGFIITIRSMEISGVWNDYTKYTTGHELTHIFEFLIEGRETLGTEIWFKEGISVYIGCLESNAFNTIENIEELESWITENRHIQGSGNPIKIHQDSDYPEGANIHQYYRLFELAMRYILDSEGLGKSSLEVLNMFHNLQKGISFQSSFENNFGISVKVFEDEFYDRLRIYLSSSHQ